MYEHVNMYVKHGMCAECGLASYMRLAGSLTRLTQEDCLEAHEATYSILWQEQAGVFRATGEYTIEARKRARRRVRGDDKTFASESAKLEFLSSAPGPLQTAYLSGKEVVINHGSGGYLEKMHSPKRRALAKEFGIKHIHFVPVKGGVMEYGRVDGQEVEVIRLLNSLTGEVLHPKSSRAFVATIVEMVGLLTFLVKMEENNILAGLAKAATALYDAGPLLICVTPTQSATLCCQAQDRWTRISACLSQRSVLVIWFADVGMGMVSAQVATEASTAGCLPRACAFEFTQPSLDLG